jgi:hypothetical protein
MNIGTNIYVGEIVYSTIKKDFEGNINIEP